MRRHVHAVCLGIVLLAWGASPANALQSKYPPGPPYRSCPDTLSIFSVQRADTIAAPCHPATQDTVLGVRGIIVAFDALPSAFGFYIQNTFADGPHAWTGVDVFTGATNYHSSVPGTPTGGNLALGDSVVVYGTTQEFPALNGETEIEGPDQLVATNDIVIRKINSGNPLPAVKDGTTHDFNWSPAVSAATAEPWEGCLVRINGPLHVARASQGLGVAGNTFLIVSSSAPGDSVLVDGFTLFLMGVPPVSTNVDFVQGILNQRNSTVGTGSVNSYRIQLRDANDISLAAPPNLVDAYPIEDNKLRLTFDKNLTLATAQNPGNYLLGSSGSGSTVNTATLIGGVGTKVELGITSAFGEGVPESITAQNIGSATCPSCLSSAQTLNFANGVLPISLVQAPDPAFLGACVDRSPFAGPGSAIGIRLTLRGVAIQSYSGLYYIEDPAGGPRSGISVFGPGSALVTGHQYRIACKVQEFGGETELVSTSDITDEGVVRIPPPAVQTVHVLADASCDASQSQNTGEDWEGTLVTLGHSMVVNFNAPPLDPAPGGSFRVVQAPGLAGTDTILVSSLGGHYTYDPTAGDVNDVTGVLHFESGSFRILPRANADIASTQIVLGGPCNYVVDPSKIVCYQPTPASALTIIGQPGAVDPCSSSGGIVDVLLSNESIDFEVEFKDSSTTSPELRARTLAAPTFLQMQSNILDSLSATVDTTHLTTLRFTIIPGGQVDTLVRMYVNDATHAIAGFAFYSPDADSVNFFQPLTADSMAFYAHDSLITIVRGDGSNGITSVIGSDGPSESASLRARKLKAFMKRNFGKKFREALREEVKKPSTQDCFLTAAQWAASGFGLDIGAVETVICTAKIFYKAWRKGRHNIYGISNSTTLAANGSFMMTVPAGMGWNGQQHVIALGLSDEAVPQNARVGTRIVLGDCSTVALDVPIERPGRAMLLQNAPNPFTGNTVIPFLLVQPAKVEVRIFDVAGRRLRSLDLGALTAGPHLTTWDGRSSNGEPLRPGTYFVRLVVNGESQGAKRALLVR